MNNLSLLFILLSLALSACNTRGTYQGLQRQHKQECERSPTDDGRGRCSQQDEIGFDDYQRERDKLIKGQAPGDATYD